MSIIKRAALVAVLGCSVGGAVALVDSAATPSGEASAALAVCRDTNGSRPGGSVYVRDGGRLGCDVQRPQRLHVVAVRTRAKCDDMGGRYSDAVDICWNVDY